VPSHQRLAAFRRFGTAVLLFTLAVILWGAFVRATGSGAGCGSHWPTCNGEVIPRAPSTETVIEFTHRSTSGIAFLLVVAQLVWALRLFPRRHPARRAAIAGMVLMVTEAGVGAGLVLFEMVAGNQSVARGAWTIAHLLNTFALVAALFLTVWLAAPRLPGSGGTSRAAALGVAAGLAGLMAVAASGAIAALGDTLFPVETFAQGWQQDLSPTAHLFIRLRVWHPVMAVVVGGGLLAGTLAIVVNDRPRGARPAAVAAAILVLVQLGIGLGNLALLAPIPLQLVHLLVADLLWLALIHLAATMRFGPLSRAVEEPVIGQPEVARYERAL
jgi:heme a synthase